MAHSLSLHSLRRHYFPLRAALSPLCAFNSFFIRFPFTLPWRGRRGVKEESKRKRKNYAQRESGDANRIVSAVPFSLPRFALSFLIASPTPSSLNSFNGSFALSSLAPGQRKRDMKLEPDPLVGKR